jgi:hypothetical protein
MRPTDDIRRFIDKAAVSISPQADKAVLDVVLAAQNKATDKTSATIQPSLRSIVMRSPITKLAAAAVVVMAMVLFIGLWDKSAPSAYALEQTVEANQSVRWLHIRNFTSGHDEPREGWIEFGEDGQVKRFRANIPQWMSAGDGPRIIACNGDTVQAWFANENRLMITKAAIQGGELNATLQELDPRRIVAHLAELKQQGKVEIVTDESTGKAEPIVVTVMYLPGSEKPGQRKVLSIDPETRLIRTIEVYQPQNGQYLQESRVELREYNQLIDAKMFDLRDQVPAHTEQSDRSGVDLGLVQGQLSDEEVAVAVVRKFYESIQAGDYEAASRLLPLGDAAAVKQLFSGAKVVRIVSVGPATVLPEPGNKAMGVPCTIEFEADGQKGSITLKGITVQQLPMQPDRWLIRDLSE